MSRTLARPPRVYVVEAICEGAFRTGDRAGSSGGPTCLTGPNSTTTLGSKSASLGGAITGGVGGPPGILSRRHPVYTTFTYVVKIRHVYRTSNPGGGPGDLGPIPTGLKGSPMKGDRLGEFEELVLLCVRHLGADAHGSGIQELLARVAGREAALGAIYAALDRTQRKGLSRSWKGEPTRARGGRAKRYYAVTPAGEAALRESRGIRERLWRAFEATS